MKLLVAIVQREDSVGLIEKLTGAGFRATRMNTAGGFLKESNTTVLLGVEDDQVGLVLGLIQTNCHTRTQYINPLPPVMEPGEFYMPYPVEVNDNRALVWFRYSSEEFADMIIDQFDEMLAQSKGQPLVCPISLHPFSIGRPYRLRQFRRALEHIMRHREQVWLTRPRDICAHIEALPPGVVPG